MAYTSLYRFTRHGLNPAGAAGVFSSLNAHVPMWGGSPYAAAKAGVEMFTKNAALELGRAGIRVNAILPGLVETPLTSPLLGHESLKQDFLNRIPLGRAATPDDIAAPALYLASEDAACVTGTSLVIDGGWEITN
ncbi:MAG: SDR family oxidoreductase [Caldilineaceae bacterium]